MERPVHRPAATACDLLRLPCEDGRLWLGHHQHGIGGQRVFPLSALLHSVGLPDQRHHF